MKVLRRVWADPAEAVRDACIFGGLGVAGLGFGLIAPAYGLIVVGGGLFFLGRWGA